ACACTTYHRRPIRRTARRMCMPDVSHRTVRPFLRAVRLPCNGAISYRLESITARELVLVMPDATRETSTRPPSSGRTHFSPAAAVREAMSHEKPSFRRGQVQGLVRQLVSRLLG